MKFARTYGIETYSPMFTSATIEHSSLSALSNTRPCWRWNRCSESNRLAIPASNRERSSSRSSSLATSQNHRRCDSVATSAS